MSWSPVPEHRRLKEDALVNGDHGSFCLLEEGEREGSPDELEHIQRSVASYIEMTNETTATVDIPGWVSHGVSHCTAGEVAVLSCSVGCRALSCSVRRTVLVVCTVWTDVVMCDLWC